jgi:hypothetical protein
MSAPRIDIVIDELVLRGVAPEHADAVAAALRAQLELLAGPWAAGAGTAPVAGRDESFRRLPAVDVAAGAPAVLGDAVAGAVFDGLAGGRR